MTRKKKGILITVIVIVVLAAAAALLAWKFLGSGSGLGSGVYVQPVNEVNAAGSGLANRYSGVIETQQTEKVVFDSSRTLKELLVAEGDRVEVGDPLFTYDTQSTELEIQQAELELERLNTTIDNNNSQLEQLEKDMKKASSADKPSYSAQIQQLQADIAQTQYDIKTKQAEIEKLKASVNASTVFATMAGTVDSIADTTDGGGGENYYGYGDTEENAYITILADGDYRVKGSVSEQNIYEIGEGMPVIVRSRVDESIFWTGTIASIDTQAETDNNNYYYYGSGESASKYAFYVDLDSIDGLMLGQHVTIEMDYGQSAAKEGLWLSSGWLVQEGDGAYVWAAKSAGARLEKRAVTLGEYDADLDEYEILSGLSTTEYIAWPDVDCVSGAATTTEILVMDEYFDEYNDDGEYYDEYYEDGESYDDGAYYGEEGEWTEDGGYFEEEPVPEEEAVADIALG